MEVLQVTGVDLGETLACGEGDLGRGGLEQTRELSQRRRVRRLLSFDERLGAAGRIVRRTDLELEPHREQVCRVVFRTVAPKRSHRGQGVGRPTDRREEAGPRESEPGVFRRTLQQLVHRLESAQVTAERLREVEFHPQGLGVGRDQPEGLVDVLGRRGVELLGVQGTPRWPRTVSRGA